MQGTWVRYPVQEDPARHRGTKPVRHNYWACALDPSSHNYWAHMPRAPALQQEKPPQWEARAPQQKVAPLSTQLEKARAQQRSPNAANK